MPGAAQVANFLIASVPNALAEAIAEVSEHKSTEYSKPHLFHELLSRPITRAGRVASANAGTHLVALGASDELLLLPLLVRAASPGSHRRLLRAWRAAERVSAR